MVKSDLNPKISIVLLDRAIQSDWILAQGGTGAAVVQLIGALTASNDDQALIFFSAKTRWNFEGHLGPYPGPCSS